jgi:hypothetical protein
MNTSLEHKKHKKTTILFPSSIALNNSSATTNNGSIFSESPTLSSLSCLPHSALLHVPNIVNLENHWIGGDVTETDLPFTGHRKD